MTQELDERWHPPTYLPPKWKRKPLIKRSGAVSGGVSAVTLFLCGPATVFSLCSALIQPFAQTSPTVNGILLAEAISLGVLIVSLALCVVSVTSLRHWGRLNERREAAAWGDRKEAQVAAEQPDTSAAKVDPAVYVGMRMRRPAKIAMWLAFIGALAGIVAFAVALYGAHSPPCGPIVVALWVLELVKPLRRVAEGQRLGVDARGLTVYQMGTPRTVWWRNARLFAVCASGTRQLVTWYDVSDADTTLSFPWLRPGTLLAYIFEPIVPCPEDDQHMETSRGAVVAYAEYDQRMRTVLGAIAEHTQLSLYDLR